MGAGHWRFLPCFLRLESVYIKRPRRFPTNPFTAALSLPGELIAVPSPAPPPASPASSAAMALLTELQNLDLSESTDKIIAEYIW